MTASSRSTRALLALVGTLLLVLSTAVVVNSIRPTEASWADQAHGVSNFKTANPNQGKRFARAISTYGFMDRAFVDSNVGPVTAFRQTPTTPSREATDAVVHESDSFEVLHLKTVGYSCATIDGPQAPCPGPTPGAGTSPSAGAVSETRSLDLRTISGGLLGQDLVTYQGSNPIRATASCSPTGGSATLTSDGSVVLGRDRGLSTQVSIPMPGPNRETAESRSWAAYDYTGTLQHIRKESAGYALSQLRLRVEARGAARWTLSLILAHAECGVDRETTAAPSRPTTGSWPALTNQPLAQAREVAAPSVAQPATEAAPTTSPIVEGEGVEGDGVEAPAVPADADTTAPENADTESAAPSEPSTEPTTPSVPEPTEEAPATGGPQQPASVRIGEEFAVVSRDGLELGSARVEDIVRTPGCGVELTLSITTSDEAGADRWRTIEPTSFAEVRPGGSNRGAKRVSSDCEQASNSKTTALQPGRDYQIVIAFQLDDSAQRAMLRPAGTAGWIFDLPPLPTATPTTSPKAPSPTTTAVPTPSEASVQTSTDTAQA